MPNFSEGRDAAIIDKLEAAIAGVRGAHVLHRTSDADHNRSVITFAGEPEAVLEAALRAAGTAVRCIDLTSHHGVHPRVGALDVLPFVPIAGIGLDDCVGLAQRAGQRIWHELGVPVYYYQAAALRADRVKLEDVRRGQFEGLREAVLIDESKAPDVGGPALHPTAGAVIVGARKILIAFNINLRTDKLEIAQQIARQIRSSNGGFACVKALGLPLASRGLVQVSMNLTDFEVTPLHVVFAEVERLAAGYGVAVKESELIGLLPRKATEMALAGLLKLPGESGLQVIESRLEEAGNATT